MWNSVFGTDHRLGFKPDCFGTTQHDVFYIWRTRIPFSWKGKSVTSLDLHINCGCSKFNCLYLGFPCSEGLSAVSKRIIVVQYKLHSLQPSAHFGCSLLSLSSITDRKSFLIWLPMLSSMLRGLMIWNTGNLFLFFWLTWSSLFSENKLCS